MYKFPPAVSSCALFTTTNTACEKSHSRSFFTCDGTRCFFVFRKRALQQTESYVTGENTGLKSAVQ